MSLRRLHSRNGSLSAANPFDHAESSPNSNGNGRNVIIVNSDIMILPGGQQESQTEDDDDDDDATLSSSGQSSGRRSQRSLGAVPLPTPVSSPGPVPVPVPAKDLYVPSSPTPPASLQPASGVVPEPFNAYRPPKDPSTSTPYTSPSTAGATYPATAYRTVPVPTYHSASRDDTQTQQPQPNRPLPAQSHDPIISSDRQPHLQQTQQQQQQMQEARGRPYHFTNDHSVDLEMQDRARRPPVRTSSRGRGNQSPSAGDAPPETSDCAVPVSSQTTTGSSSATMAAKALGVSEDLRNNRGVQGRASGRTNIQKEHHPTSHSSNEGNHDDKSRNSKQRTTSGFFAGLLSDKSGRHRSGGVAALMGSTTPGSQSASGSKNNLIDPRSQLPHHHHHMRNDMVPEKGTTGTGIPGKNGEVPETDMFKFVGIMLDLPEEPTWRQINIKFLKVLAVMTVSYFCLMALYFGAEVISVGSDVYWVFVIRKKPTKRQAHA